MKRCLIGMFCLMAVMTSSVRAEPVTLPERTPVKVALLETLVSGQGKPNNEVAFELREDIYGPNRELLAAKGTPAYGHIIRTKKRGMFGRSGKLEFSCDYVKAIDGTKILLRGSEAKSGRGNGGAMMATAMLVSVVGVLVNGRDISAQKGSEYTVYIENDTVINPGMQSGSSGSATYSITISPKLCQELAQKLASSIHSGKQSVLTIAIADFELRAEKESMRLDPAVGKNAREDMGVALSSIQGFKVIDSNRWDEAVSGLNLRINKDIDPETARQVGGLVKASCILTGTISDRGTLVVLSARMIDTQSGEDLCTVSVESQKG